jgi:hypothetical protein
MIWVAVALGLLILGLAASNISGRRQITVESGLAPDALLARLQPAFGPLWAKRGGPGAINIRARQPHAPNWFGAPVISIEVAHGSHGSTAHLWVSECQRIMEIGHGLSVWVAKRKLVRAASPESAPPQDRWHQGQAQVGRITDPQSGERVIRTANDTE